MARTYVAIVGLLVLGLVFAALGSWQWQRAETSRATRARFDSGATATSLADLPAELDDAQRFRRVEIRGEYLEHPQFLLDNMVRDGAAGYYVLTPLRVPGRREHVLVNRGWVPAGADRRVLPDVAVPGGLRNVAGRLERLPRPGMRLGGGATERPAAEAVAVLQYPTADELEQRLGEPVYDYQLLLDAAAPDGFTREWRAPGVAPERHVSYAGQWWALAASAVAAALGMGYRTARRKP